MAIRTRTTLHIGGMTCAHCEKAIEQALLQLPGVIEVNADFKAQETTALWDSEQCSKEMLIAAVEDAGYVVKPDHLGAENAGALKVKHLIGLAVIVLAVYLAVDRTVGFNFIPEIPPAAGFGILFVIGLMTSLHCIAMCGGLNLSQCVSSQTGNRTTGWKPSLLYNGGRVISYTIVGGIVGALGSAVSFSGSARGAVALAAGFLMVIMGFNMLGLESVFRRFNLSIPYGLRSRLIGVKKRGPFFVGLLNGLMPCGPLQSMQIYALGTGSAQAGAMAMLAFSLGTVPLMFGFGAVSTLLSKRFNRNMMKISAVMVILLGVIMLQRGVSLGGLADGTVLTQGAGQQAALSGTMENGVLVVEGEVSASAYPEIVVQKGVPVRFNLHATAQSLNGCNDAIVIPEYNIKKGLAPGDNIVEFTPTETGTFGYTCWMGMISSTITVVEP